ncbi:aldo/keto reductase [Croceitalea rosinachiae]|uniref:Aldo/keto reductase n=1 Tax=Croceitalea rosinachiae TaxID=3075596 RepID=A0ABU3A8G4_9FLAO|nr:aldo/keto reductase [Croceitalea sp. F388]MDT0606473.1 aldo/keto reductase [Croceitalea sp. F388]
MQNTSFYSKIIAGTMTWGSWGKRLSTREIIDLMNYCLELGISSFDHADIYGDYGTESDFGKAFAQCGIKRSDIQLITKCGIQMINHRKNKVAHYQYDSAYITWSVEQSLKNLQTDYVDLLLLHRPSPLMQPDEIAEAIQNLLADGKIKKFGVSNFTPPQIEMLEMVLPVEANQVEFSLTHDDPMYDGTFNDCIANKRMAMSWSPLGTYFREENQQNSRIKLVIDGLKEKYDVDESQLLLAFILKHPVGIYPVVGTATKDRLKASMQAVNINLDLQDWFKLLEASKGEPIP